MAKHASTAVPLHPLLAERWSPRGFDEQHRLSDTQVMALLEAARWAPSSVNSQPWRFLVGHRGDSTFAGLLESLAAGNRLWAGNASALTLVAAETADPMTGAARSHAVYDAGQAVALLTAQAQAEGLGVHQMGGFSARRVTENFGLDAALTPVIILAVGKPDPAATLPDDLATRERAPRVRKPLEDLLIPVAGTVVAHSA